jgi:hypothetical protein
MVIRLWRDGSTTEGFRARILRADDLTSPDEHTAMATTNKEVVAAVEAWLAGFSSS